MVGRKEEEREEKRKRNEFCRTLQNLILFFQNLGSIQASLMDWVFFPSTLAYTGS